MGKKTIHYIGFYKPQNIESEKKRFAFSSAIRKMDYICQALLGAGFNINIISPSWVDAQSGYYSTKRIKLDDDITVTLSPSFGSRIRVFRALRKPFSYLWLVLWVLKNIKKGETVLVYHSLLLVKPIKWIKKLKDLHIILEVEELYCDVSKMSKRKENLELEMLKLADSFILSTDLLPTKIDLQGREYIICYGEYLPVKNELNKYDDGKIHLVYAGIIDQDKLGAFNAIESVRFLNENYTLHIVGFGLAEDVMLLEKRIDEINKSSKCRIYFHGEKNGDEYIEFMQKCHIGLSTQRVEGKYLESSFPSKILSYLTFGLSVVSCEVECVKVSKIGHLVTYYKVSEPELIAEAIQSVKVNNPNKQQTYLMCLHKDLINRFKKYNK